MKEAKISKSKQKKLDTENRRSFTQRVFQMTLQAIPPAVESIRKVKIGISGQNYNRYVRFSAYGQSCSILIYKDGNVAVQLKEAFHKDYNAQVFAFTLDENAQRSFETHFREVLGWLIPVVLEAAPYDFHTFMDYVSHTQDYEKAHELVDKDFRGYDDPGADAEKDFSGCADGEAGRENED